MSQKKERRICNQFFVLVVCTTFIYCSYIEGFYIIIIYYNTKIYLKKRDEFMSALIFMDVLIDLLYFHSDCHECRIVAWHIFLYLPHYLVIFTLQLPKFI